MVQERSSNLVYSGWIEISQVTVVTCLELCHLSAQTGIIHSTNQPVCSMLVSSVWSPQIFLNTLPTQQLTSHGENDFKRLGWSLLHNCDPNAQCANFREERFILLHDFTGSGPLVRKNLMAIRMGCERSSSIVAYRKQRERSLGTKYKNLKRHSSSCVQPPKTSIISQNSATNIVITPSLKHVRLWGTYHMKIQVMVGNHEEF